MFDKIFLSIYWSVVSQEGVIVMRLEQLEFFVETAKNHSMRSAADKLHASPQNVSKAIKQLEDELAFTLFIRSRQGLYLTPLGQEAYKVAQDILEHADYLTRHLGKDILPEQDFVGQLHIASSVSLSFFAMALMTDLAEKHPRLNIHLTECERLDTQSLLPTTPYDMMLLSGPPKDLAAYQTAAMQNAYRCFLLKEESLNLIMSSTSALTAKKSISAKTLSNLPLITYTPTGAPTSLAQNYLGEHQIKLNQALQVNNLALAIQQVCDSKYYFLSCHMLFNFIAPYYREHLTTRPLSLKLPWLHLMLLPKTQPVSDAARLFLQTLLPHFHGKIRELN